MIVHGKNVRNVQKISIATYNSMSTVVENGQKYTVKNESKIARNSQSAAIVQVCFISYQLIFLAVTK